MTLILTFLSVLKDSVKTVCVIIGLQYWAHRTREYTYAVHVH